jgi:hypothetical protein
MSENIRRIPVARFEPTDIGRRIIWGAVGVCTAALVSCALLVAWLYPGSIPDRRLESLLPLYPAPRLQTDPAAELRALRAREMAWLEGTGWVDKTQDVMHIPIAQAMQQIALEGIPGWPAAVAGTSSANGDLSPLP